MRRPSSDRIFHCNTVCVSAVTIYRTKSTINFVEGDIEEVNVVEVYTIEVDIHEVDVVKVAIVEFDIVEIDIVNLFFSNSNSSYHCKKVLYGVMLK